MISGDVDNVSVPEVQIFPIIYKPLPKPAEKKVGKEEMYDVMGFLEWKKNLRIGAK